MVRRLDAAAALLGADKPLKMVFDNYDGTWDVGCTLEGESDRLKKVLSLIYLDVELPDVL